MSNRPLTVLLVEDEPLNRALVRTILARHMPRGSEPRLIEADTIAAARSALSAEPIDVVLLDVRLPDGSGLDLAEELRDGGANGRPVPLIAILSASVLADERAAAESSGADAFLGKPFVPGDLIAMLDRFGSRVAAREASERN